MSDPAHLDAQAAFARYEAVRERLPQARYPEMSERAGSLADIAGRFDGFVLDAFGVLNVGDRAVPGAVERMADLRAQGLRLCVLTNAASYTRREALQKYHRFGFDFTAEEVVSSRDVAAAHLEKLGSGLHWAAIAAAGDDFIDLPGRIGDLLSDDRLWRQADGFVFLSSARWTLALQDRLVDALIAYPRPVVIANPDIVAPREDGLTIEPGFWAHDVADRTGVRPAFFGKPYAAAFAEATRRLGGGQLAMVGDTLHTDILGGKAAGLSTVLVTDHGLFAGLEISAFVTRSGIAPDVIVPTT